MNIINTAPFLADFFVDTEIDMSIYEEYKAWLNQKSTLIGPFYKYITSSLHDSEIIGTDFSDNNFTLRLNHSCTELFANVICERNAIDIDHKRLIFPVEICFNKARFHYYKIAGNGQMRHVKPVKTDNYLGEQIISANDNGISLGFVLWRYKPRGHFYLAIHAMSIEVNELQESAWKSFFGERHMDAYHYFQENFNTGLFLNNQTQCEILYDEFLINNLGHL